MFLVGCVFIPLKYGDRVSYEGYTFDEVWQASMNALTDSGYGISFVDRKAGILQGYESVALNKSTATITIVKENGRLSLDVQMADRSNYLMGVKPKVKRLLAKIKENLKKEG
ncbi:hypothetical protein ES703_109310 [subsurface metagenome]